MTSVAATISTTVVTIAAADMAAEVAVVSEFRAVAVVSASAR